MKLERYVELKNGEVLDSDGCTVYGFKNEEELQTASILQAEGLNNDDLKDIFFGESIDEFEYIATDDWHIYYDETSIKVSDITRTSPDIWGLVKEGWLVRSEGGTSDLLKQTHENSVRVKGGAFGKQYAKSLFAPITENGKITRYELVWEREE